MKDEWYADKRDLVKWGGIVHLCETKDIKTVIQVAYYRESTYSDIKFDKRSIPLNENVKKHFRDIRDIKRLGHSTGIDIKILDDSFYQDRSDYHLKICNTIQEMSKGKLVFLDPDTGLNSGTAPSRKLITTEEVNKIWGYLKPTDILVFYQQAHRFKPHLETFATIKKQLAKKGCLNVKIERIHEWFADKIDVRFFFIERTKSDSQLC